MAERRELGSYHWREHWLTFIVELDVVGVKLESVRSSRRIGVIPWSERSGLASRVLSDVRSTTAEDEYFGDCQ